MSPAESVTDGQSDKISRFDLALFLVYFSQLIPCGSGTGYCIAITIYLHIHA